MLQQALVVIAEVVQVEDSGEVSLKPLLVLRGTPELDRDGLIHVIVDQHVDDCVGLWALDDEAKLYKRSRNHSWLKAYPQSVLDSTPVGDVLREQYPDIVLPASNDAYCPSPVD